MLDVVVFDKRRKLMFSIGREYWSQKPTLSVQELDERIVSIADFGAGDKIICWNKIEYYTDEHSNEKSRITLVGQLKIRHRNQSQIATLGLIETINGQNFHVLLASEDDKIKLTIRSTINPEEKLEVAIPGFFDAEDIEMGLISLNTETKGKQLTVIVSLYGYNIYFVVDIEKLKLVEMGI